MVDLPTTQQLYQFRSRFPEFDSVPSADINTALTAAMLFVDQNVWSPADYPAAVLYWAANYLALKLMSVANIQLGGVGANLFISSISFGERHVSYGQRRFPNESAAMLGVGEEMLLQTMYGEIFLMLRSRNVVPLAIV